METIAKLKFLGIEKEEFMYIGGMPFEDVCRTIERMINTNNLVQNAECTKLRRVDEINTPSKYAIRTRVYWCVLDGQTHCRVTVKELR